MVGLLAFTGMAVDVGYLQWSQMRIQDAADAAVQAALIEAKNNTGNEVTAGRTSASLNGFTNGQNGVTVTINQPPTAGTLQGNAHAIEAIVTKTTPTYFMQMLNFTSVNVSARAAGSYSGSSAGCVYVLDTASGDSGTLQIDGSNGTTFNCGVVVESPNAQAATFSGAETITIGTNYTFGVVGPDTCTAAQPATNNCGIYIGAGAGELICPTGNSNCTAAQSPTANGISNPGDPLSSIAVPSFGTTFATKDYWDMNSPPTNNTLSPGIYCGGLTIGNTNGATYTLNAGTYIIAGGNLEFNSTGTVSGSGVTFYLTSPADVQTTTGTACSSSLISPTSTTIAKLVISGQPHVTLSAPATGASSGTPGMLFFENRSSTTDNAPSINGNAYTVLNGALYFKNSTLTFTGVNAGSTGYMMLVVKKLMINGASPVVINNINNPLSSSITGAGAVIEE